MENPYMKQKIINDIKTEDVQIQVTGYVKAIEGADEITLDDKTGELRVDISNVEFIFQKGDLINVIGEISYNTKGEKTLEAKIIQDMKKLNFNYYKKLYELKKELLS